jgi:hypothetical protein
MAITFADITRTSVAAAICGLADAGAGPATIQIATSGAFSTILATFTLSDPAYTAGAAGVQNLDVTPALSVVASNSGTATNWRLRDSAGNVVFSGLVAATADGSDLTLADIARNAALTAINTAIGASGDLQITTSGDTSFASPLITLALGNPAFGAASTGSMTMTGTPSGNATAAGTAGLFRIRDSSDVEVLRGTVGTSGADMNFSNNVFGIGSTITITSMQLQMAATSATSVGVIVFAGGVAFTNGETVELLSQSFSQPA